MAFSSSPDIVLRALTDDGAFRVIVAFATDTVKGVMDAQKVRGKTAERLAELVTGAALMREAMAPGFRAQVVLQAANKGGNLVADAQPDGSNRGIVNLGGKREVALDQGGVVQVLRSTPRGVFQGVVQLPEAGGVSGALMAYLQDSEQITGVLNVRATMDGENVERAAGYFIQLLQDADRGLLMVMTERLAGFPPLETWLKSDELTARVLLDEILYGMPFTVVAESELRFGCNCSQERFVNSLMSLPKTEIADMIQENVPLDIRCDGCGKEYVITVGELIAAASPSASTLFGGEPDPKNA